MPGTGSENLPNDQPGLNSQIFNIVNVVKFVLKFNEKDPDVFFYYLKTSLRIECGMMRCAPS